MFISGHCLLLEQRSLLRMNQRAAYTMLSSPQLRKSAKLQPLLGQNCLAFGELARERVIFHFILLEDSSSAPTPPAQPPPTPLTT